MPLMLHKQPTRETIVDFIGEILTRHGAESYMGEEVTMLQHMLQSAHLAEKDGADDQLVAAALLHDIGHFFGEFGEDYVEEGVDDLHEKAGAKMLAAFFPPLVVECVRLHVAAKRYLCRTKPDYFNKLSFASVRTLALQGGPMDAGEASDFEKNPFFEQAILVRLWDEGGKSIGAATPDFAHYAPLLARVAETER